MNKKGITLIEIIISIVLISIVLIFLFSLLVTVKDINYNSKVNSTYLINKSLIIKKIEEDFERATSIKLESCKIKDFYTTYPSSDDITYFINTSGSYDENLTYNKCLKFTYTISVPREDDPTIFEDKEDPNPAFLGIYYYKSKEMYVISYVHGYNKSTRTLPKFENSPFNRYSLQDTPPTGYTTWKHNGDDLTSDSLSTGIEFSSGFHNIYIPILGEDGKDYSLNISYYKP